MFSETMNSNTEDFLENQRLYHRLIIIKSVCHTNIYYTSYAFDFVGWAETHAHLTI